MMNPFLKTAGWSFTVFYLYQAGLYLPEYFAPRSVMPCVTRLLDAYIAWFVFPLGIVMAGIIATDIIALRRSAYAGLSKALIFGRVALGSAGVLASTVAFFRILRAG
jgi:hypothetical protein